MKDLKKFVRSSAAGAQSKLGGGAHDHLGILDDDASYFQLTGHHFIRPVHLGPLVIAAGTALDEAILLRDEHSEATRLFCETLDVENVIKKNPSPLKKLVFQNFATATPKPSLFSSPKF